MGIYNFVSNFLFVSDDELKNVVTKSSLKDIKAIRLRNEGIRFDTVTLHPCTDSFKKLKSSGPIKDPVCFKSVKSGKSKDKKFTILCFWQDSFCVPSSISAQILCECSGNVCCVKELQLTENKLLCYCQHAIWSISSKSVKLLFQFDCLPLSVFESAGYVVTVCENKSVQLLQKYGDSLKLINELSFMQSYLSILTAVHVYCTNFAGPRLFIAFTTSNSQLVAYENSKLITCVELTRNGTPEIKMFTNSELQSFLVLVYGFEDVIVYSVPSFKVRFMRFFAINVFVNLICNPHQRFFPFKRRHV